MTPTAEIMRPWEFFFFALSTRRDRDLSEGRPLLTHLPRAAPYGSARSDPRVAAPMHKPSRLSTLSWSPPWSVFDCQTTGLDAGLRLIEVAMIDHNGRTLVDTLVNPRVHISASATALSGIDDAAVRDVSHWGAIWQQLEELLLSQNHIIAWSAEFDLTAMRSECARSGDVTWTTAIDARFVDLAPIVSKIAGRECSFEDACAIASCPAPSVGRQRALAGCLATLQIVQVLRRGT